MGKAGVERGSNFHGGEKIGHGLEHEQAEALRNRLAAIVEGSDDAIISKTLDGIITSWNRGQRSFTVIPPRK